MTNQRIHRSHLIIAATWKEEKFRRLSNITKNFKKTEAKLVKLAKKIHNNL